MSTCVKGMCGTRPLSRIPQPRGTNRLRCTLPQPSLVNSLSVVPAGQCHRQSCSTFKPRPSAYRLCRKARSHVLSCTAVSGAQPMQPVQPTVLHKAAASIVSLWQHSLRQLASFVRVQRKVTPTDSTVCKHQRRAHVCNWDCWPQHVGCELQEINAKIRSSIKNMKCLAAVAPFAAVGGSTNTFILITKAVGSFIKVRTAFCPPP